MYLKQDQITNEMQITELPEIVFFRRIANKMLRKVKLVYDKPAKLM